MPIVKILKKGAAKIRQGNGGKNKGAVNNKEEADGDVGGIQRWPGGVLDKAQEPFSTLLSTVLSDFCPSMIVSVWLDMDSGEEPKSKSVLI